MTAKSTAAAPDPAVKRDLPSIGYILSPSYSGSTLLTMLMARHPEIATIGELKASALGDVGKYHCCCGELLRECPFWIQVEDQIRKKSPDFALDDFGSHFNTGSYLFRKSIRVGLKAPAFQGCCDWALRSIPAWKEQIEAILNRNRDLIEVISNLQGGRVFLDGSKDSERLRLFLRKWGDAVKVIYLVRDGRGVSNSYMKHYQAGMKTAVREWSMTIDACDRVFETVPEQNRIQIRYEDLCADPDGTSRSLFQLLGLAGPSDEMMDETGPLHILGNAMRLGGTNSITLDEKWRRELSSEDIKIFEAEDGPMNRRLGYDS